MSTGPAMTTPKPEPMSAERPKYISAMWGESAFVDKCDHAVAEAERLYALALEKELDRLRTALVAANAELVSERAAHAETEERARHAESVESELRTQLRVMVTHVELMQKKRLASITSNAPAKADTIDNGPAAADAAQPPHSVHVGRVSGAAGPASKPLVVGLAYPVKDLPIGATIVMHDVFGSHAVIESHDADGTVRVKRLRDNYRYHTIEGQKERTLVSLPSAKADQGKACDDYWCAARDCPTHRGDPAPPALTRSEVMEMIVDAFVQWRYSRSVTDVRAALSDGGE